MMLDIKVEEPYLNDHNKKLDGFLNQDGCDSMNLSSSSNVSLVDVEDMLTVKFHVPISTIEQVSYATSRVRGR